jgi:hypothetical protein
VAGWCYQLVCQLNFSRDSWTWPVDVRRACPGEDAAAATVTQVRAVAARAGGGGRAGVPLFVFDAGSSYDPAALAYGLAGERAQVLVRLRKNRVFFADPLPRGPHMLGAPARHGAPFDLKNPATWGAPDTELVTEDPVYGRVWVRGWARLHPRLIRRGRWAGHARAPIVRGWVIRAEVTRLPKPGGATLTKLWLWWSGPPGTRPRSRPVLAGLCPPVRHRAHHPVRQNHPRLGHPRAAPPRASRPVDRAHPGRLRPARPRPPAGRRPSPALGTPLRPSLAHPRPRAPRLSAPLGSTAPRGKPTQTLPPGPRTAQRTPRTPRETPPSHQESRLITTQSLKRQD